MMNRIVFHCTCLGRYRAALLLGGLVGLFLLGPARAQTQLTLQPDSRFWIEGTTSVNRFTCRVDTVHGQARLPTTAAAASAIPVRGASLRDTSAEATATLTVPVRAFDCGKKPMTEDLKETLRANRHPQIRFVLEQADVVAAPDSSGGWYQLQALGHLTISGTERLVRVTARGRPLEPGRFRVQGNTSLRLTYFGIEPPSKFMGLVQVHNRIEVHFDLTAAAPQAADLTACDDTSSTRAASCGP